MRGTLPRPGLERPTDAAPGVEAPKRAPVPVPTGGPKIRVDDFQVEGNSSLPDAEIQRVLAPMRGQKLTLFEIYEVADRLTDLYRDRGFTLAQVTVPAQRISEGTVRLQVVEGRLAKVTVEGNDTYTDAYLAGLLTDLAPGDVIRAEPLRSNLLLLNDLPGLTVRGVVTPGEAFGTSDLVLRTEEDIWQGEVRANNYGRESIGQVRAEADLTLNNPFGRGDRLFFTAVNADGGRMNYVSGDYSMLLNARGTRVGFNYGRFVYRVDTDALGLPTGFTLDGAGTDMRLEVSHPLVRSRAQNVYLGAAWAHSGSVQGGSLPGGGRSVLNFLEFSGLLTQNHADNSSTTISGVFTTNGRRNADGTRDNAHRGKLELDVTHTRPLPWGWSLFTRFNAGVSLHPLMNIQRYRIGGTGNVRAFPSAELAGDMGFMGTVQVDRVLALGADRPAVVRLFWDGGAVSRKAAARAITGEKSRESLTGIGTGITLLWDRLTVDLEGVLPLNSRRASDGRRNGRIWASIGTRF